MDKIINLLINNWTKGVDTYTHNGSTWLIFTEQKSWVIELTESKTLWYNYNFFKDLFSLASMDVVNNQYYITKWVEDNIINGVNHTNWGSTMNERFVGDVIKDGVKVIEPVEHTRNAGTKNTIKYGVKETKYNQTLQSPKFKEALKNGVIMSNPRQYVTNKLINDTIENGIKKTNHIKNNVRETKQFEEHLAGTIGNVITNGVKETKTPGKDGDIMSTIEWMEENKSTSYTKMIDDVIDNGEKINGTYVGGKRQKENVEVVIDYGVKEIKADSSQNPMGKVTDVIDNGVKQTKPIGKESFNRSKVVINHIIQNGTKNPSV
jgi:hypothetical protein